MSLHITELALPVKSAVDQKLRPHAKLDTRLSLNFGLTEILVHTVPSQIGALIRQATCCSVSFLCVRAGTVEKGTTTTAGYNVTKEQK